MAARLRIFNKLILSKLAIKPSSPTPCHLKTYNISLTDNFMPPIYVPFVFFYPYTGSSRTIGSHQEKATRLLKKSLSQTLTQYYPFSGKLVSSKYGSYVDCNDEGVEFVEARVNGAQLSQVVDGPHQSLDLFFPTGTTKAPTTNSSLLKAQVSYFDCGGLAVAVLLSHKIGDACTLYTFIKHWATVCHNYHYNPEEQLQALPPHFLSFEKSIGSELTMHKGNNCVSKRFVFPNSEIEKLKAEVIKAGPTMMNNPTRVEVVNSLLYSCAVRAKKTNQPSFFKLYFLIQTVNMRKRLANPLQETTVGNLTCTIQVPTFSDSQLMLNSLTARIKKAKSKLTGITISELNRLEKLVNVADRYVPRKYIEVFVCTSLCGYPVYQIDFGWGKPIRVTFPGSDNFFILMDTPSEDGIEALVTLEEEDMAKFQVDEQLLAFASAA